MKHRSKRQEAIYKERRPLVAKMLEALPWCQACPLLAASRGETTYNRQRSVDVHELVPRSGGGSILDPENLIVVCRSCHRWIGNNPKKAELLGLHMPSWSRNNMWDEARKVRESWATNDPITPSWL